MHYLLILVLTVMMAATGVSVMTNQKMARAELVQAAAAESNVVKSFVIAAEKYVQANPYNAAGVNDLDWASIKATPGVGVGIAGASVPDTWRVRRNATSWVVCATVMSELSAQNLIGQAGLMPAGSNALISVSGTTSQFVLGDQDANTKAALITRCA